MMTGCSPRLNTNTRSWASVATPATSPCVQPDGSCSHSGTSSNVNGLSPTSMHPPRDLVARALGRHGTAQSGSLRQGYMTPVREPMNANRVYAQPVHGPATQRTDDELMRDLALGQQEALGPLYSRYAALVFNIAHQSLDRPAADDIVQEVFLTIWRGAASFDPPQG